MVTRRYADKFLVGGSEAPIKTPFTLPQMKSAKKLRPKLRGLIVSEGYPCRACRPTIKTSKYEVLGEGAAVAV